MARKERAQVVKKERAIHKLSMLMNNGRHVVVIGHTRASQALLLDEIENMSLDLQVRLMHMLQEQMIEYMSGNQLIPLDIWVIAPTREDLRQDAE